ncbi:hypothetical protein H0I23_04315 [Cellulophaga sp. HaHaR_3_176]|uniref:hypothetical protein n=1 Tax=Cellulophaga sp. HaHaR_3_176 TaxID=1942464 RepID=UPI001C1F37E7|nr:hypothetical protein [Cellulophaga sp. HaHaR_3_176]QWX84874.1 hypothetical protein H0I23_04315 [Cellulophaga sp. HaHaR_3_176]
MSKKLIAIVFKKVEADIGSSVPTRMAQHLSVELLEEYNYQISERTLRNYYNNFLKNDNSLNEALKPELIKYLCKYLGYNNYAGFVSAHPSEHEEVKVFEDLITKEKNLKLSSLKKNTFFGLFEKGGNRIVTYISVIIISALTYFGFVKEEQNCMVWQEDHYVKSTCTGVLLEKPYQELIFKKFKKIKDLNAVKNRREQHKELWYVKTNGVVEFFTYHGNHPINNKGLKEVTDYMFKTYVLDELENVK